MDTAHIPVLLSEAVAAVMGSHSGVYVDGTFGRGGHSQALLAQLDQTGRLIGIDRDPDAANAGRALAQRESRFTFVQDRFSQLDKVLATLGLTQVDGVLLDLGISSPQIDEALRGFSFRHDAPLDMRMDPASGESAAAFLARAPQQLITKVLKDYGEERFAAQIARAIVVARQTRAIERTGQLVEIVRQSLGSRIRGDWQQNPATRTFQALRIQVNEELNEVMRVLPKLIALLKPKGRLAVISFHSLEDRLVKRFIACASQAFAGDDALRHLPLTTRDLPEPPLKSVGRAIRAGEAELANNPRARSATLRVAERTTAPCSAAMLKAIVERAGFEPLPEGA